MIGNDIDIAGLSQDQLMKTIEDCDSFREILISKLLNNEMNLENKFDYWAKYAKKKTSTNIAFIDNAWLKRYIETRYDNAHQILALESILDGLLISLDNEDISQVEYEHILTELINSNCDSFELN